MKDFNFTSKRDTFWAEKVLQKDTQQVKQKGNVIQFCNKLVLYLF